MSGPLNKLKKYSNTALRNLVMLGEKHMVMQKLTWIDPNTIFWNEETGDLLEKGTIELKDGSMHWNYPWMLNQALTEQLIELHNLAKEYNMDSKLPEG